MPNAVLMRDDCLTAMQSLPDNSVDSIVCDPPYGLANTSSTKVTEALTRWLGGERDFVPSGAGFMGREWDAFVPPPAIWDECLRVLKPGGHLLAFTGSRTADLLTIALRLSEFEIRDSIMWIQGSGMPKGQNVAKALTKKGDAAAAARWDGWNTSLKPGYEPCVVARKPLEGTVVDNLAAHGVGALNIDANRIDYVSDADREETVKKNAHARFGTAPGGNAVYGDYSGVASKDYAGEGRWPANVILDEAAAEVVDAQSGLNKIGLGGSRFFYVVKAGAKERPVYVDDAGNRVSHETVKPLALMRHLVRLVTPTGGVVLDPFGGSGTTAEAALLEGFDVVLAEREAKYWPLIEQRIARVDGPDET